MDLRKSGLSIRNAKLQDKFQAFFLFLNGGASFRWSFGPLFAWDSTELTTILTTNPSLIAKNGTLTKSKTQIPTRKLKIGTDVKYRWLDTEHVVLNVQSHMIC